MARLMAAEALAAVGSRGLPDAAVIGYVLAGMDVRGVFWLVLPALGTE